MTRRVLARNSSRHSRTTLAVTSLLLVLSFAIYGILQLLSSICSISPNPQQERQLSHRILAEDVHKDWLDGESLEFIRVHDYNASFAFVSDAPSKGIDPIRGYLLASESHIRSLFHHLLFMPGCVTRETEGKWGSGCVPGSSHSPYKERVVLDIGANRGWYSLMAGSYGHRVIAFDPQPHCVQMLKAEILLSGLSHEVRIENAFVGVDNTSVKVTRRTGCMGGFPGNKGAHADKFRQAHEMFSGAKDQVNVNSVKLDDLFASSTHDILLLKVDTEGSEREVFASAENLLRARAIRNVVVELNSPKMALRSEGLAAARSNALKGVRELLDLGYHSKASHRGSWSAQRPMTYEEWDRFLHPSNSFVTIDAWFFFPQ